MPNRELNVLRGVWNAGVDGHFLPQGVWRPFHQIKRLKGADVQRDTVWTQADLDLWLDHLQFDRDKTPVLKRDYPDNHMALGANVAYFGDWAAGILGIGDAVVQPRSSATCSGPTPRRSRGVRPNRGC